MQYWIAVACREHVRRGVTGGFCQVCHGKQWPLKQMRPGDGIVYYSSKERMGDSQPCQRFTAIGRVREGQPYTFATSSDFVPFRRDIEFLPATDTDIASLIDQLTFILDKRSWGYPFRRGFLEIPAEDFTRIAAAMGAEWHDDPA